MSALIPAIALLLALPIDRLFGEPPLRLHPVVWMGNYLGWAGRHLQAVAAQASVPPSAPMIEQGILQMPLRGDVKAAGQPLPQSAALAVTATDYKSFWLGAIYWSAGAAVFSVAAWWLEKATLQVAWSLQSVATVTAGAEFLAIFLPLLAAVLLALLLKPMLAWAMLKSEVLAVEAALAESLPAGRERLGWLVSRDTAALSDAQVRESAIESLAENLNDSVVAPIFWFVLLGLPGAVLYRFANTADAMWGYKGVYKGQNWAWAGKWAARVDDALNWLPARLTGLLLWLLVRLSQPRPRQHDPHSGNLAVGAVRFSLLQLRREAAKTPSPNSGWPMAAMALALNIHLGKPGVYVLNPAGGAPLTGHTTQAIFYASKVLKAIMSIVLIAMLFISWMVS